MTGRPDREGGIPLREGEMSVPVPTGWAAPGTRARGHMSPKDDPPPITGTQLGVTCPPKGHVFIFS